MVELESESKCEKERECGWACGVDWEGRMSFCIWDKSAAGERVSESKEWESVWLRSRMFVR